MTVNSAVRLVVSVHADSDDALTNGSVFIDDAILWAIRPHMARVDSSIAETIVSTGGRSIWFMLQLSGGPITDPGVSSGHRQGLPPRS